MLRLQRQGKDIFAFSISFPAELEFQQFNLFLEILQFRFKLVDIFRRLEQIVGNDTISFTQLINHGSQLFCLPLPGILTFHNFADHFAGFPHIMRCQRNLAGESVGITLSAIPLRHQNGIGIRLRNQIPAGGLFLPVDGMLFVHDTAAIRIHITADRVCPQYRRAADFRLVISGNCPGGHINRYVDEFRRRRNFFAFAPGACQEQENSRVECKNDFPLHRDFSFPGYFCLEKALRIFRWDCG
ncbi:hypothetical protein [uncultured Victivallis sp.]|uniref:hypothetical protein n=1 Tax=uncultured Victivallis sp. TaxID=354118 RepID=UPI0025972CE4|nr:hypothetical protein [uncultured Victivallis sp.]